MGAHGQDRGLICPVCLKTFETHQGRKAHQKSKRHTTHIFVNQPWEKYHDQHHP